MLVPVNFVFLANRPPITALINLQRIGIGAQGFLNYFCLYFTNSKIYRKTNSYVNYIVEAINRCLRGLSGLFGLSVSIDDRERKRETTEKEGKKKEMDIGLEINEDVTLDLGSYQEENKNHAKGEIDNGTEMIKVKLVQEKESKVKIKAKAKTQTTTKTQTKGKEKEKMEFINPIL